MPNTLKMPSQRKSCVNVYIYKCKFTVKNTYLKFDQQTDTRVGGNLM